MRHLQARREMKRDDTMNPARSYRSNKQNLIDLGSIWQPVSFNQEKGGDSVNLPDFSLPRHFLKYTPYSIDGICKNSTTY